LALQITLQHGGPDWPVRSDFCFDATGRFFARKVVPSELRALLNKTELRVPLGADRRTAIAQLPAALW
jgi:hypothetical protein